MGWGEVGGVGWVERERARARERERERERERGRCVVIALWFLYAA